MKKQINLYQPSCYPKREKATFKQFLSLLGVCLLSIFVLLTILSQQFANTQDSVQQQKSIFVQKQSDLSVLSTELQNKRAPEIKVKEHLALQSEIAVKQQLLASLAGIDLGEELLFSQLMRGLSLAKTNAISIDDFSIVDRRLNISGQAKKSDSVPLWLSKIQMTKELSGIAFEKLKITDSQQRKGFFFQLSNDLKTGTVKVSAK